MLSCLVRYLLLWLIFDVYTPGARQTVSIVFIVTTYPTGTGVLRGKHFVDTINNTSESGIMLNAHLLRSQDMAESLPDSRIDVCVIVKVINQDILNWCKSKNAYTIFDVLDNKNVLNIIAKSRESVQASQSLPRVNMMLVSNMDMRNKLEKSKPRIYSEVLYHQHTNPGVVRPRECIERNVSSIGFLVGADLNMPSQETLGGIHNYICNELGSDYGVSVVCISQQLRKGNEAKVKMRRLGCKGKRSEPTNENEAFCANHQYWKTTNPLREFDNYHQLQFHIGKGLDAVDIGIIWPGIYDYSSLHRPSTRLLYWMSHGVPCVFYPNHAYLEIARNMNYTFPRGSKYEGLVPAASSLQFLSIFVAELVRCTSLRLHFRNIGIEIAATYTTESIANELRRIIVRQHQSSSINRIKEEKIN